MRRRQVISVCCLFAASTLLPAATISVEPAAGTVTVGQTFTLSVDIFGASDLYAFQFDLGFDSSVLKALSMTEGAFLGTGGPTIFIPGTIDNVGGSITATGDILNGAVSGVNGDGELLSVSFQALAGGWSNVQVFNLIALDSVGLGLAATTASSTVTVTEATAIPEPGTWLLLWPGVAGFFAFRRWRHA